MDAILTVCCSEGKLPQSFVHLVKVLSPEWVIRKAQRYSKCSYTRKPATYKEWIKSLEDILSANLP